MKLKRTLRRVALLVVAIGFGGMVFSRHLLLVDQLPRPADAIVLLGGGLADRPRLAAALFKSGVAPRIIVTGWGDCLDCKKSLMEYGVPESVIDVDCAARNTNENAQNAIQMLRARRDRRAVLVTTWYHSRRALAAFQFYGPELRFTMTPTYHHLTRRAFPTVHGGSFVFREYLKMGWYFFRHGIPPGVDTSSAEALVLN